MLRFTKLEISNFGPYQGTQVIDFPTDDGVVIVWGYNGFGKTSIMKAIRFALWGKIIDDHNNEEPLASYVNHEAVERGEDMKVVLHMNYDEDNYVLTRCLERRENSSGINDSDYAFEVFLQRGVDIVSPTECGHFLRTAIPEAISRFYLFDGELLQQYENLLKSENDNSVIKDSIEDILGLPILEISRDNLALVLKDYSTNFTKVSSADERTKQAAKKIEGLVEKEDEIKGSIAELESELSKSVQDLGAVDAKLEETETYRSYTQDIRGCESVISDAESELEELKEAIRDSLDNLWEAPLNAVIGREITLKTERKDTLSKSISESNENRTMYDILSRLFEKHDSDCNCPICNALIDEDAYRFIGQQRDKYSSGVDPALQQEFSNLEAEIRLLRSLKCTDNTSDIRTKLQTIEKLKNKIALKGVEKERLESERRRIAGDNDEGMIDKLMPEHDRLTGLINTYKKGISDANEEIEKNKAAIEKLRLQIKKNQSSTETQRAQDELDICQQIFDLFNEAIERFKLNLKDNVQRDATAYFTSVAHNPDYTELSINEEYGLEILTGSGVKVPHRSSGYVQVVAISLIAALHKNAPISGPIIMDSTFQRIDPRHKSNILESLPSLGRQVIVLAYPDEIQDTTARNVLKGKLRKEVSIKQISSFNSIIEQ